MRLSKRMAIIGLIAGICSSLFGIGGGLIISPLLVMWLGFAMSQSVAQSITAVAPILMTSAIFHFVVGSDTVSWATTLIILCGALFGSHVGTLWLGKLSNKNAIRMFSVFLLLMGLTMMKMTLPFNPIPQEPLYLLILGLLTGVCSGLFGIGGGTIMVPILSQIFGIPFLHAAGISILVALPVSIFTAIEQHFKTGIEKQTLYVLVPFSLVGVWFGYYLTDILDVHTLKILFGCIMFLVGARMFFFDQTNMPRIKEISFVWWQTRKKKPWERERVDFYPLEVRHHHRDFRKRW